jgi:hypothetical protein
VLNFFLDVELVYKKKEKEGSLILKNLIVAGKKSQHSRVWPKARKRKLVIGNLCCSLFYFIFILFYFQVLSLFDLIFSLDSKSP